MPCIRKGFDFTDCQQHFVVLLIYCMTKYNTVEPLYNGQIGASGFCLLYMYEGVLYRDVLSTFAF